MEKKRVAVMQPYFFPYIGYFHLLHAVDFFVLYDNIQYTKKGWINRNRFLRDGTDAVFTIPLRKASDFLCVDEREVAESFDRRKLLKRIQAAYQKAPFFETAMELFARSVEFREANLFRFIKHSIGLLCEHLHISTTIIDSSSLNVDHNLSGQDKVLAFCDALGAATYVNAIGGRELYDAMSFESQGIQLRFIQSVPRTYKQLDHPFVAWLSILDVLMFNSRERVSESVARDYRLIQNVAAAS